ncbi:MAG: hypothetical protein WAX04_13795 [Oscillospiraceae bacterium]
MPSTYDIRLIQAGKVVEIIEYEKLVVEYSKIDKKINMTCQKNGRKSMASVEDKQTNRMIVLYRARNEIRRLVNTNVSQYCDENGNAYMPVFLTLTFSENIQDIAWANNEFRKFIKRLGNHIAHDQCYLKYLAVIEFQKRGAVHYHLIIFNLPYMPVKEISEIWRYGYIWINAVDHVDNLGAYVVKYMNKDNDDERLAGHKCYFSSRGLYKPKEIKALTSSPQGQEIIKLRDTLAETIPCRQMHTNEHESDYYGTIRYDQFKLLNNSQEVRLDG